MLEEARLGLVASPTARCRQAIKAALAQIVRALANSARWPGEEKALGAVAIQLSHNVQRGRGNAREVSKRQRGKEAKKACRNLAHAEESSMSSSSRNLRRLPAYRCLK